MDTLNALLKLLDKIPPLFQQAIIVFFLVGVTVVIIYRVVTNRLWFRTRKDKLKLLDSYLKSPDSDNEEWNSFVRDLRKTYLFAEISGSSAKGAKRDALIRIYMNDPNCCSLYMLKTSSIHLEVINDRLRSNISILERILQYGAILISVIWFLFFIFLAFLLIYESKPERFMFHLLSMAFCYLGCIWFLFQSMPFFWADKISKRDK